MLCSRYRESHYMAHMIILFLLHSFHYHYSDMGIRTLPLSIVPAARTQRRHLSTPSGLELQGRYELPPYVHPPAYEAADSETQQSITEPIETVPLDSNTTVNHVHSSPLAATVVAAVSVDRRAVMIAISSFLLTSTGCGLNFAFGVYQELYETSTGPFHGNVSPAKIDLMGTRAVSLMTIGAPFASA